QTERLEQHRLTAGVRTGDEQRALGGRHRETERNDVGSASDEQRMSAAAHVEAVARRGEGGGRAARRVGEARPRVEAVELDEGAEAGDERVSLRAESVGELAQDALDFFDFIELELSNLIAELHGGRRFDEQRSEE